MNDDFYSYLGAATVMEELGLSAEATDAILKKAAMVRDAAPETRTTLLRKIASTASRMRYNEGDTHAGSLLEVLCDTPEWTEEMEKLAASYGPEVALLVKEAGTGGTLLTLLKSVPGGLHTLFLGLLGAGALGGGVAHYKAKEVNADQLKIEKRRAEKFEYQRMLAALERQMAQRDHQTKYDDEKPEKQ